jgi:hypothetical protein
MKKLVLIEIVLTVMVSCFPSYKINPKSDRQFNLSAVREPNLVYVINSNDSLKDEAEIIEFTGLYKLSSDSTLTTRLKLYPLTTKTTVCGNAMIGSIITLGLLPTRFPNKYVYTYDIMKSKDTITHNLELDITQQLWLFNLFSNKKNFKKQAGKAIAAQLSR